MRLVLLVPFRRIREVGERWLCLGSASRRSRSRTRNLWGLSAARYQRIGDTDFLLLSVLGDLEQPSLNAGEWLGQGHSPFSQSFDHDQIVDFPHLACLYRQSPLSK